MIRKLILHSSICLSHNRPNQFSVQIHAILRAELKIVVDDSTHTPCAPHGSIGAHNEDGGIEVVEVDCVDVVVVVEGQVAVGQDDVVVVGIVGITMY